MCASSLVYADPGYIRFFPARPEQWKSGSVTGLLLRGGITVKELTWNEENAKAILISKTEQTITVENSMGIKKEYNFLSSVFIVLTCRMYRFLSDVALEREQANLLW